MDEVLGCLVRYLICSIERASLLLLFRLHKIAPPPPATLQANKLSMEGKGGGDDRQIGIDNLVKRIL